MRLPGTRYQEHGWEQVRKLLGACSLLALRQGDMARLLERGQSAALLDEYTDLLALALNAGSQGQRAEAAGNSYGESVHELALSLVFELQAQPAFWDGFLVALANDYARIGPFWEQAGTDGILRKKVNDMFVGLRDKVDADNYQVATGQACSPNKMYTYRMLDMAYREIARLFADWQQNQAQVAAILGRPPGGLPIEVRQMKSIAGCRSEWLIRWSETLEQFQGAPGPLHTRSKRFASLKNSPEKIAAMMAEIGDYEELSSNLDSAADWQSDAGEAALWLDDYWRVVNQSLADGEASGPDQILAAPDATADGPEEEEQLALPELTEEPAVAAGQLEREQAVATGFSLPPRFMELARAAQDGGSKTLKLLKDDTLAIRLAVYQKILGAADEAYPDAWRDPATGELPTLQQLAALDGISMPTLRKRRNEALARLQAAGGKSLT